MVWTCKTAHTTKLHLAWIAIKYKHGLVVKLRKELFSDEGALYNVAYLPRSYPFKVFPHYDILVAMETVITLNPSLSIYNI